MSGVSVRGICINLFHTHQPPPQRPTIWSADKLPSKYRNPKKKGENQPQYEVNSRIFKWRSRLRCLHIKKYTKHWKSLPVLKQKYIIGNGNGSLQVAGKWVTLQEKLYASDKISWADSYIHNQEIQSKCFYVVYAVILALVKWEFQILEIMLSKMPKNEPKTYLLPLIERFQTVWTS